MTEELYPNKLVLKKELRKTNYGGRRNMKKVITVLRERRDGIHPSKRNKVTVLKRIFGREQQQH